MYVYTYTCIKPCLSTPSFLSLLISEKHPTLLGVLSETLHNPPPVFAMPTEEEQEDHKQEQHHEKGGEDQGEEEQEEEEDLAISLSEVPTLQHDTFTADSYHDKLLA